MQQASLPALQQKNNEISRSYGSREQFLAAFNPDVQRYICDNPDLCFFGGAPTLYELNDTYGEKTAAMWLVPQLYNLSEYCGCREKLEGNPLKECASVIAAEFYYLSVSELMLFFHRFKSGRYGRFYGSVDPMVITSSIRLFARERILAYEEHEKAEEERAYRESAKNALSWEEYCMKEYGKVRPHPFVRPSLVPQKSEKPKEDPLEVYKTAKWLAEETDKAVKWSYGQMFQKKHGCTPEEYVERNKDLENIKANL